MELQTGHLHKIIPEASLGEFKISHRTTTLSDIQMLKMRDYREYYDFKPGTYTILHGSLETIMSDTPMEIRTNVDIIRKANGKVLIGGLGLGLILLELQKNPEIESVLIIEKNQEIIDMVLPHLKLDNRFKVVQGDIFTFELSKEQKFDTIYFDIWNGICEDNYDEMKELHKRYRKNFNLKNPQRFIDSWRKNDCKRLRFSPSRNRW